MLRRDDVTADDSFVSLEGDSLSYVEMSIRVEQVLGHLPAGWHTTPIRELVPHDGPPPRGRSLETNVALRALAIVAIVGSHANLFVLLGGAHVLLAVAGFNLGRFHLTDAPRAERLRHLGASIARVAVPSVLWIGPDARGQLVQALEVGLLQALERVVEQLSELDARLHQGVEAGLGQGGEGRQMALQLFDHDLPRLRDVRVVGDADREGSLESERQDSTLALERAER